MPATTVQPQTLSLVEDAARCKEAANVLATHREWFPDVAPTRRWSALSTFMKTWKATPDGDAPIFAAATELVRLPGEGFDDAHVLNRRGRENRERPYLGPLERPSPSTQEVG